jgi:hypothetical protein
MFLAGYIGLSVPVLGLGFLTLELATRDCLLIFTLVLAAAAIVAAPLARSRPTVA